MAENSRVDGPPDPDAWAEVARRWTADHQPYPAAYALLRQAEAAFAVRARSAAGADALRQAAQTSAAMGAQPLLAEIRELAELARVVLYEPGAPDKGAHDTRPHALVGTAVPASRMQADTLEALTDRELEVLRVLAGGLTNRETASKLFVSEKTVGVHVGRIYQKLGVRGRVQATSVFHRARPGRRPS